MDLIILLRTGHLYFALTYIELWLNKVYTQQESSKYLKISTRHFRRLIARYKKDGPSGLIRKKATTSNRTIPLATKQRALKLIQDHFYDYGPTLAAEKLFEHFEIKISKETIRKWMIEVGLHVVSKKRKKRIHMLRARRACKGELIQVDGSHHPWFEDRAPKCTLLVYIDDATSEILTLEFAAGETTNSYMKSFRDYVNNHGVPQAMYTDRHNVFKVNPSDTSKGSSITQFGRILKTLGCEAIFALSAEAKGRVERANRTLQDRLVKALRYEGISDIKSANKYLKTYLVEHNNKFSQIPANNTDLHKVVTLQQRSNFDVLFSKQHYKKVFKGLIVKHDGKVYKLKYSKYKHRLLNNKVLLCENPDNEITIYFNGEVLDFDLWIKSEFNTLVLSRKDIDQHLDLKEWLHEQVELIH